jgi:hypothetical protein
LIGRHGADRTPDHEGLDNFKARRDVLARKRASVERK